MRKGDIATARRDADGAANTVHDAPGRAATGLALLAGFVVVLLLLAWWRRRRARSRWHRPITAPAPAEPKGDSLAGAPVDPLGEPVLAGVTAGVEPGPLAVSESPSAPPDHPIPE